MAIYKCKMCGGDLNITSDVNIVECEYCGTTQTVPTADNEKKMNLFNRANRLRLNSEFDKAAGIYENIIAEFPEEAEAYWGLCLCNYGIEYVDDPATGKKVPTCHRASFEKLTEDENFSLAMEYADVLAQKVYRNEAREIDRIMDEILSISKNEKPYDVFICYKETDLKGERTIDSVLAQDIYDALTAKGLKVFFARITLEDKLGQMYEPYIFAALNSAKVLLSVGTNYENFHAVWVKNEWSRFLKLMAKDKSKVLIPCYKDMDAYDLPDEFKALQAQDMGKIGFMQDLVRGVEKILGSTQAAVNAQQTAAPVAPQVNSNIKQLMINGDTMYTGEVFADVPHGNGKAEYKNGAVYEGQWNRGKRHGQGKIVYGDCVYEGQWADDKEHGQGKLIWNKGGEFAGEFSNGGVWRGNGVFHFSDGCYTGNFENGKRHGYGIFEHELYTYEGQWEDGKEHGDGKKTMRDGAEIVGEFRGGEPWSVKGKIFYADSFYEGELIKGKENGYGKLTWNKGGEFVGEFRDGEPWNGKGIYYYSNGCYYNGEICNGLQNGYGVYRYEDSVYEGKWTNNTEHGQGKLTWDKGGEFVGEFRDGEPYNGSGVYYFGAERYEGEIKNGKRTSKLFGFKIRY